MKTVLLWLGFLSGAFVVVAGARLLAPRDPSANVEGQGAGA